LQPRQRAVDPGRAGIDPPVPRARPHPKPRRLHINISGCINACGHHHVGHIGLLGVEKNGEEFYQITIGGRADEQAALGDIIGPASPYARSPTPWNALPRRTSICAAAPTNCSSIRSNVSASNP